MGARDTRALMTNPNYYAGNDAAIWAGGRAGRRREQFSGALLRPLIQLVKLLPHSPFVSACLVAEVPDQKYGDDGVLFLADCGVVPDPDVEQLRLHRRSDWHRGARQVFGTRPRIAMPQLFYEGQRQDTVHRRRLPAPSRIVRDLAEQLGVEIAVGRRDAGRRSARSRSCSAQDGAEHGRGKANVLIFPDLNSGNIAAKLVQYLAGARVYGQISCSVSLALRPTFRAERGWMTLSRLRHWSAYRPWSIANSTHPRWSNRTSSDRSPASGCRSRVRLRVKSPVEHDHTAHLHCSHGTEYRQDDHVAWPLCRPPQKLPPDRFYQAGSASDLSSSREKALMRTGVLIRRDLWHPGADRGHESDRCRAQIHAPLHRSREP